MKKSIVGVLTLCMIMTFVPVAGATEYEALPQIEVERYQIAPKVLLNDGEVSIQEVPEECVLNVDGKIYVDAGYFIVPAGIEYLLHKGKPVALVPDGETTVLREVEVRNPVYAGTDGYTYIPLADCCDWWGIGMNQENSIITLSR